MDDKIELYPFGGSAIVKTKDPDRKIVGGKGLGLQVMSKIGVDVPPGFTMPTTLCPVYAAHGEIPSEIWNDVEKCIARIEKDMNKKFGDETHPLLFSVRSGAAISMP
eukprot:15349471-Ditylum_brightwellii.AAC.1